MISRIVLLAILASSADARSAPSLRETSYGMCDVDGIKFGEGEQIIQLNKCRTCECVSNDNPVCSPFEDDCGGCRANDKYYKQGEEFQIGCAHCTCNGGETGEIGCVLDSNCEKRSVDKRQAMGYYMGMAFAKLQQQKEKDRMLQSRKSRGTDTDEDKNDRQKKSIGYYLGMAYAKLEEQRKKNRMSDSRKTRSLEEETDINKKSLGYLMGLGHAKLEENRRRKNKRTSLPVAGCDWGDEWFNVGESWGDGCQEPRCECRGNGDIHCSMYANGCRPSGCDYNGNHVAVGDQIPDPSGCGGCTCHEDNLLYCTQMLDCSACFIGHVTYAVGDQFTSPDGCNTCTCSQGGNIACTQMLCIEDF